MLRRKEGKELQFKNLLIRLNTSSRSLIKTQKYCTELTNELETGIMNHLRKQKEYLYMALDLAIRESRHGPDIRVSFYCSFKNEFLPVATRAEIFCKKVKERIALKSAEFKKIKELTRLGQDNEQERMAKEDPVGIEMEFEQAMAKTKEIQSELDSLKAEWHAVKDELNNGLDSCIQLINLYLQHLISQEFGPGEE